MPIATTTASPWPGRCAYISATIFIAASGATNIVYGWSKGDSIATSLVWAGVAGAVAAGRDGRTSSAVVRHLFGHGRPRLGCRRPPERGNSRVSDRRY